MTFGEDDDPPSITDRLLHADAAHEKADRRAKAKGKLLSQVQLASLKNQVTATPDATTQAEQAQDARKNDVPQPGTGDFGTKTLEQQSDQEVQTAQQQWTTDQLITQGQRQDDIEQQAEQEYQQDMG